MFNSVSIEKTTRNSKFKNSLSQRIYSDFRSEFPKDFQRPNFSGGFSEVSKDYDSLALPTELPSHTKSGQVNENTQSHRVGQSCPLGFVS